MPAPRHQPPFPWKPTHRITFTPTDGPVEEWLVMFTRPSETSKYWDGFTEREWQLGIAPDWLFYTGPLTPGDSYPHWRGMQTPQRRDGRVSMERLPAEDGS